LRKGKTEIAANIPQRVREQLSTGKYIGFCPNDKNTAAHSATAGRGSCEEGKKPFPPSGSSTGPMKCLQFSAKSDMIVSNLLNKNVSVMELQFLIRDGAQRPEL